MAKLRAAAEAMFGAEGYHIPTVEDLARQAGVSRPTFYRYFDSKLAAAVDLFERHSEISRPLWLEITHQNFRDERVILDWLNCLFNFYEERRHLLRTFSEAAATEPKLAQRMMKTVPYFISEFGKHIPAFAVSPSGGEKSLQKWARACILLQQILDQCSISALGYRLMDKDLLIRTLASSFSKFVNEATSAGIDELDELSTSA